MLATDSMLPLNSHHKTRGRVVVLGARGFIATTLLRHLSSANDIEILTIGSTDIDLSADGAAVNLASRLRSDDAVVMLSAITPDKGRDMAAFMKNLIMMKNVCVALKHTPVSYLIYFSSDAVYGLKESVISEATSVAPSDLYGAMHLSRELMVRELSTPAAILRVTMVYGPGDTHASYGPNRFFKTAEQDGKISLFGGGEELRDHIHVEDVAALTVKCLTHRYTGLLNIATGRSTTFQDVAHFVAQQFDSVDIVRNTRASPITYRHYDVTNLIKAFPGFRFTTLQEGLRTYRHHSLGAS